VNGHAKFKCSSTKRGVLVDRNGKHVRLSMKSGVFVDKSGENSELSIETGVFMDGRIEII
jgi:hypothetical protein